MKKKYFRLTSLDREKIQYYRTEKKLNPNQIAIKLGYHRSTITREVARNTDSQGNYQAQYAHKKSYTRIRSRKLGKRKILLSKKLQEYVHTKLRLKWSPDQIAKAIKNHFSTDTTMHISPEAIYQYIYILPRGELKKTLIDGLRQRRRYRRSQRQKNQDEETRGKIKDMLSIHERPQEVIDRILPGHWESDLIIGKYKQTGVATLVERTTRFTIIVPLPEGKGAVEVRQALTEAVKDIPKHLRLTLTHDQGKEMSEHAQFSIDSNMTVYFADPRSPWQRGTNENTNGLIRQYYPKGTDFRNILPEDIKRVQYELNTRPRKILDYKTPLEVYNSYVALDLGE
jgi:IS30 family transposase